YGISQPYQCSRLNPALYVLWEKEVFDGKSKFFESRSSQDDLPGMQKIFCGNDNVRRRYCWPMSKLPYSILRTQAQQYPDDKDN
ncbi:MAG: hypothetical protein ACI3XS_07305, partial [Eubacteriales bacterium]